MVSITLWDDFHKSPTSTKVPSGGTSKECVIPGEVSVITPRIRLSGYHAWNYCYIPLFNRYYFIENVVFDEGDSWIYCVCDVMASNRAGIRAHSAYVSRCAESSKYDNSLIDNMYPTKVENKHITVTHNNPWSGDGYLIQVTGLDGAKTWVLNKSSGESLFHYLWQSFSDTDLGEGIARYYGAPTENIISIKRTRYSGNRTTGTIHVGLDEVPNLSRQDVTGQIVPTYILLNVPHPTENRAKNTAVYSLWIPGAGYVQLNNSDLVNSSVMELYGYMNMDTGNVLWAIYAGDGQTNPRRIAEITGKFAVETMVSFQSINISGIGQSLFNGVTSALTSNILGFGGAVISAIDSLRPTYTTTGNATDWFGLDESVRLECVYQEYSPEDITNKGRPCCKVLTLSTCPGFVMCQNPNFTGAPTSDENSRINAYLESGAYIE